MGIHIHKVAFCKLLSKAGSYNLGSVKTEYGVYDSAASVIGYELLGNSLSLCKA